MKAVHLIAIDIKDGPDIDGNSGEHISSSFQVQGQQQRGDQRHSLREIRRKIVYVLTVCVYYNSSALLPKVHNLSINITNIKLF